jgi:nitrite reductase/ring-hydroxylating ferredoxin subunit
VAPISKIRIFYFISIVLIISASCSKKSDVIPDVYVDFTIDLNDPEFVDLNAVGGSDTVNYNTNNIGRGAAGYAGNGIIITAGVDEFYAYDRTCPHDYAVNDLSIKINLDSINFMRASCPSCGTEYELMAFGTPASGIGNYPLKNYKTSFDGRWIRVWNNY